MKKICFLLHGTAPRPVGGVKVIYQYANMFVKFGYDVTILFCESRNIKNPLLIRIKCLFKFCVKKIIKYDKCDWFSLDDRVKIKYLLSISDENLNKFNFVIATMLSTSYHLYQIKNKYHLASKCFYFVQDFEAWGVPEQYIYESYKLPLKKIAISQWLENIIRKVDNNVICIPNGFDFNYFTLSTPIENRNRFEISMLYHIDIRKRCSDAFSALELIKKKYPQLHVNIFGAYPKPSNLPNWYTYVQKPTKEIHNSIYNSSSIFINASAQEGWGLTVGEAMICGCAVVCSNNDGHRIMAKHDETAFVFEVGKINQIVKLVERLIEDDLYRIRIARNGNQFIQQFSWDNSVKKFIDVLEGKL